ncbi:MAG TPA: hypothetical protein VIJ64_04930 [Candidatus Lustribacter sp.]
MSDRDPAEQMISDLGLNPALDVDSDQRAELLRSWHEQDAEKDAEKDPPRKRDQK